VSVRTQTPIQNTMGIFRARSNFEYVLVKGACEQNSSKKKQRYKIVSQNFWDTILDNQKFFLEISILQ